MTADTSATPPPSQPWVIATRESRLALWQAEHVRDLLQQRSGRGVHLLGMTTQGDQILDRALSKVGGKGLFVKELEVALETGRADLAVHSLKDVPMELPEGFLLAAVMEREDPRDALVSPRHASLQALPEGAVVGTSSLRRLTQLRALRPDLRIEPLRGNLDTRLRKLDEGLYDAIVLAAAGLKRLDLGERIREFIDTDTMLPAAGQGALGLEIRQSPPHAQPSELHQTLMGLAHEPTWLATAAERAVSRALGGSCSMPLAAFGDWQTEAGQTVLRLRVRLGHAEHVGLVSAERCAAVRTLAEAEALGREAAADLRGHAPQGWLDTPAAPGAAGATARPA